MKSSARGFYSTSKLRVEILRTHDPTDPEHFSLGQSERRYTFPRGRRNWDIFQESGTSSTLTRALPPSM